jgi:predicted lipoprotein with Yx(FWY)xxD motif
MTYGCDESPAPTGAATGDTVNASPDGSYLVGPTGMTLYTFDNDSPDHSACTNPDCSGAWPALTAADSATPTSGDGVSGTLATFDRGNGIMQVEYNGKPLYYFIGDSAPGDTSGDGVNGVWHLAKP